MQEGMVNEPCRADYAEGVFPHYLVGDIIMGHGVDLHLHTCFSPDGEISPGWLVEMCRIAGMRHIAVADHNNVDGVAQAIAAGEEAGVTVVPCVELDCAFEGAELHVLGYFIDYLDKRYDAVRDHVEAQEMAASQRRLELARSLGIEVDQRVIEEGAGGAAITAELIAEVALAEPRNDGNHVLEPYRPGGSRSDNPYVNFYWDHFAVGKPLHIHIAFMSLAECLELIEDTGGVAVLAHPGQSLRGREALFPRIAESGIRGVEAFSSYHSSEDRVYWHNAAKEQKLAVTCGSDFHGKTKPAISIGGHGADTKRMRSIIRELYTVAGRNFREGE